MNLKTYLQEQQPELVKRWVDAVFSAYAGESARFFKDTKDPFANPVGNTIKRNLNQLFGELIQPEMDREAAQSALEAIVRIRAVQDLTPEQALSFIYRIKNIIGQSLAGRKDEGDMHAYLSGINANVDSLMLMAVNLYVACREKIYALKARQAKNEVRQLLIKKGLMCEIPDSDPEKPTDLK